MEQSIVIRRVIAGVIERDGLFLIAQRAKRDAQYGLWEFPGGKVEVGETDQECLARELFEEFVIHAEIGEYLCESTFISGEKEVTLAAYRVLAYSGEFELRDHLQIKWVTKVELDDYMFPHPDLTIIRTIRGQL
jgi:mutator protein MutT